ncbi:MAG: TetR/AcrR family transcriptional regulator [Actinobacteria bacterium]|nr:TetR/AcrR family transcriptional regulator [Actinomycetota bacterium]
MPTRTKSSGSARSTPDRPKVSRAQKTREVQEAITASALELLAANGVDGLALTKIAAHAGMSNGPLYGRYDSAEDVALELWEEKLRDHFNRLILEFDTFASSKDSEPSEWLLQELDAPSALTAAAIEIVCVARRFPLLVDSVRDEVDSLFQHICAEHPNIPPAICSLRLTVPTGCVVTSRSVPKSRPPWKAILLRFRDSTLDPANLNQQGLTASPVSLSIPAPDTGDVGLDEFVSAVMEVVARVGFEKTTAHRVARAAGHSFSSAYTHVGTKDELMHMAIGQMMTQIWQTGTASFLELSPEGYKNAILALQFGLLAESNRPIRQLRTETTVAMRHHTDLAAAGRKRTAASLAIVLDAVEKADPAATEDAAAFWYLTAANGIGTVSLSLLTDSFRDIDWTSLAAVAYEMAYATTIEPLSKLSKA